MKRLCFGPYDELQEDEYVSLSECKSAKLLLNVSEFSIIRCADNMSSELVQCKGRYGAYGPSFTAARGKVLFDANHEGHHETCIELSDGEVLLLKGYDIAKRCQALRQPTERVAVYGDLSLIPSQSGQYAIEDLEVRYISYNLKNFGQVVDTDDDNPVLELGNAYFYLYGTLIRLPGNSARP